MSQELPDSPLYYYLPELASVVHSKMPSFLEIQSALIHAGYEVSQFHKEPMAIKTNASNTVVWDIMRAYCVLYPPKVHKEKVSSSSSNGSNNKVQGDEPMVVEGHEVRVVQETDTVAIVDEDITAGGGGGIHQEAVTIEDVSNSTTRVDVASIILSKKSVTEVNFTPHPSFKSHNSKKRIARFPPNPESNWGPKRKATSNA